MSDVSVDILGLQAATSASRRFDSKLLSLRVKQDARRVFRGRQGEKLVS